MRVAMRVAVRTLVLATIATTAACEGARTASDSTHVASGLSAHAAATLSPDRRAAPQSTGDSSRNAAPARADTSAWSVSVRGIGPVTFGMRIDAAARVAGGTVARPPQGSCGYVSLRNVLHGARFMVSYDTVVRVDVDSASVSTDSGARVGMREDSVQHLYANRLRVTPHKYVSGGHYLIFIPGAPADTTHQLIFETDGNRVTRYRAGLAPYVSNVEGCG